MKYLINTLNNEQAAARIIGAVVNFAMIVSGGSFFAYVVYSAGHALKYW